MKFFTTQIKEIPDLPGIYRFYSSDHTLLYVGKARSLRKRISSYFDKQKKDEKTIKLVSQICYLDIIAVGSEFEALLLEAKLIKEYQPKYNVVWRDDKHYIYIKITRERFPKIVFARKADGDGEYFGPFPSSRIVKQILSYVRSIFPYCTQKENAKRACFYNHIGLCHPCPAVVSKLNGIAFKSGLTEYRRNIQNIRKILLGRAKAAKQLLTRQMAIFSENQKFELAAIYRDKLVQLDYLVNHYTPVDMYTENPELLRKLKNEEQQELRNFLKPYYPEIETLNHVECYDISNISGKLATGSMITFIGGQPYKNLYRRFRIKLHQAPNDFAMLSEMMTRRLKHTEWKLPDLMLIDGGKPQLVALGKIMNTFNIEIPLIGLAKKEEEIVIPHKKSYAKIKLPNDSPALNLVKRLRDEAHRFAHNYHSLLRLKYLLSSVPHRSGIVENKITV